MDIDFLAFERQLALIASDPPSLASFRATNPTFVSLCAAIAAPVADGLPKPFPEIGAMTAIQAAIFDNWPEGKPVKNQPSRYGMAIEIWTQPAGNINVAKRGSYQHKGNVQLLTAKELKKRIAKLQAPNLRNPISPAYAATLTELHDVMLDGDYAGLIATKTPTDGTFYHSMQFVFVTVAGEDSGCILSVGDEQIVLPKFSPSQPNGDRLKGENVILQSRLDRVGFSTSWATEQFG